MDGSVDSPHCLSPHCFVNLSLHWLQPTISFGDSPEVPQNSLNSSWFSLKIQSDTLPFI